MSKNVKRYFSHFQPKHYDLTLNPEKDKMTFEGTVTITGKKTYRPNQRIVFHQKGLKITSATITKHDKQGNTEIPITRIVHQNKLEEVRLHTEQTLYPAGYTITMSFKGKITRPMNGMYPSTFTLNGKEEKLIATQFESHHAREVLPCIDEPEAKATFQLTITTPRGEAIVSNTPVEYQETRDDATETRFETTPIMSTYLLAFVYGKMGFKESQTKGGVVVRTYATPDNVQYTDFALETTVRCLEFYEEYFGIPYPLPKVDMIALPDFASGAMENWGCITYREQCLLVDPKNSTLPTKQYVAMVVAHELAHMWFGNLVTMRWWTDLWLNEGFATWIEYLATDALFPDWQMWTQFAVDEQQQALKLDALQNTHPVEVAVHHPDEIRTIFDTISYAKGASVIHQLHAYLGADDFRKGLQLYLTTNSYKNTLAIDLWQAFEQASGKPITAFMQSWITQPGFPVVNALVDGDQLSLSQHKFLTLKNYKKDDAIWPIPLLPNNTSVSETIEKQSVKLKFEPSDNILLLNQNRSGFYRVSYDSAHLQKIAEAVKNGKISVIDRLGVLSDVIETAKTGDTSTIDALKFLEAYSEEENSAVWDIICGFIGSIRLVMNDDELRDNMKPFIQKLATKQFIRLGWDRIEGESYFDSLLRPSILALMASSDHKESVDKCKTLFEQAVDVEHINPDLREAKSAKEVKRGTDLDPDMRGVVFGTIARLGGTAEFDKLYKLYKHTHLSEEKLTISSALTDFKDPDLVKRSIDMFKSDDVRLQDLPYWIAYSMLNRYSRQQTWQWIKDNWQWLHQNIGNDLSFMRMPIYAARVWSEDKYQQDYIEFFTSVMSPSLDRTYKQGLEMMGWQSAWRTRDLDSIKKYFSR